MAEYTNVEKPFLDKLQHLGWKATLKKWCCQKYLKEVSKP